MFKDVDSLRNYAIYSSLEQDILTSQQRPIVLLQKKENQNLSNLVAPNIKKIGCFLPNSALHYLLFE